MKTNQSPAAELPEANSELSDDQRLAAIKAQVDPLFRQAGNGNETRTLYRALLDYRMGQCK